MICKTSVVLLFGLILGALGASTVSFDDDVTLTEAQQLALIKFKDRMFNRLEHDWMREDIYLVRWLRARKFNVALAEQFLDNHLRFRKEVNFDRIHEEDFSDLEHEYPYDLEGFSKDGKPLLMWYLGDWNIQKASITGNLQRLNRYTDRMYDQAHMKIRDLQKEGKNVTRFAIIMELSNINFQHHLQPTAFPYYATEALSYDQNFPGLGDKIMLINTPGIFQTVLTFIMQLLTPETRNSIDVQGSNKKEWLAALNEYAELDQVTATFGGTKITKSGF